MKVDSIWRYPVKSMAGERLSHADIDISGVPGDRMLQVYDRQGRMVTARRYPRLLQLHATLGLDGEPLVDGLPWRSPEVSRHVEAAVAPGATLQAFDGPARFDILPLLVCTDGAVSLFGRDVRRLRPNLVINGVAGAGEREWEGAHLRLGELLIGLTDLRGRCVMTTVDPDNGDQDPGVLRDIVRRLGGRLCLNALVISPGTVAEGDDVELVHPRTPASPRQPGGRPTTS
jgi:uncharacterized protein YcbX